MKKISLLGSTGSIGRQTLEVVKEHPEAFQVVALAAMNSIDLLEEQIHQVRPALTAVFDREKGRELARRVGSKTTVVWGMEGLLEAAAHPEAEMVLNAVTGSIGLEPTLEAIKRGKDLALANKETLVVAGELVMEAARKHQVNVVPVDSEHSAIFQCLQGEDLSKLEKLMITASGGPFRTWEQERIAKATVEEALRHPNWSMGKKITIDSATLMNKGLEVIEARWLFDVNVDKIEVVVHPQSIVHSMIQLCDGSVLAQLGMPDMKLPIQYALAYPERLAGKVPLLDFGTAMTLEFAPPQLEKFPCLALAYEALRIGGTMPCVVNGANEVLVEAFIQKQISFYQISEIIEQAMGAHQSFSYTRLEEVLEVDRWVRDWVRGRLSN